MQYCAIRFILFDWRFQCNPEGTVFYHEKLKNYMEIDLRYLQKSKMKKYDWYKTILLIKNNHF